jgi:hypothetical protein
MPPTAYLFNTGAEVQAMQLTAQNLDEVAAWVDGTVIALESKRYETPVTFIGVRVPSPIGREPRYARIGDWVVKFNNSDIIIYIYPNGTFSANFQIL